MFKLGDLSELKEKVVNLRDQDSPHLFSKYKSRIPCVTLDRMLTDEARLGQSSILYGLSSIHSDSLPLLGINKEPASGTFRINKLFNGIKSICQDTVEVNDLEIPVAANSTKYFYLTKAAEEEGFNRRSKSQIQEPRYRRSTHH
jgi:hypothetical protein